MKIASTLILGEQGSGKTQFLNRLKTILPGQDVLPENLRRIRTDGLYDSAVKPLYVDAVDTALHADIMVHLLMHGARIVATANIPKNEIPEPLVRWFNIIEL